MRPTLAASSLLLTAGLLVGGCSSSTGPNYNPTIPASLSATLTNPFFPFAPGQTYVSSGQTAEGFEVDSSFVLAQPRVVNGVSALEIHDLVYLDGNLIEDTYDWYAEDAEGNVWYLGEDTKEILNGQVVSTEGSWEWGVQGALPGIIMAADPAGRMGKTYREEYLRGVAEDQAKVIDTNRSVTVAAGSFTGCVVTDNFTTLEPTLPHEHKTYCAGIGIVLEEVVGGSEQIELQGVTP